MPPKHKARHDRSGVNKPFGTAAQATLFPLTPSLNFISVCGPACFHNVLPPLITRQRLSIRSVKRDAARTAGRLFVHIPRGSKVSTVCFLRPYVTINLRLGPTMLKNEGADCSCSGLSVAGPAGRVRMGMGGGGKDGRGRAGGRVNLLRTDRNVS